MDLSPFLEAGRVLTLGPTTKAAALERLVDVLAASSSDLDAPRVLAAVREREREASTRIAPSLALPHARLTGLARPCYIAVARCASGIDYEDDESEPVRLLVLVVAASDAPGLFLAVLAELARVLGDAETLERVVAAPGALEVLPLLVPETREAASAVGQLDGVMLSTAAELAARLGARALVINLDVLPGGIDARLIPRDRRLILAGQHVTRLPGLDHPDCHVVKIPIAGHATDRQVRLVLLFCLSRGVLDAQDVVVCLTGAGSRAGGDTLVVTRVDRECRIGNSVGAPGGDVRAEVLERVVELACQLASEGREGHPIGTVFAVGDSARVQDLSRQLVINPFHGHPEESRNVLDPTLAETVKEFANIDGAFVIRGDGVVLSAGTYLRASAATLDVTAGLGTRHHAAAAMSAATDAFCVAISASTGTVTVFKGGATMAVLERNAR